MSYVAATIAQESISFSDALSQVWAQGVRRILWRRQILTIFAAVLTILLSGTCLITCLHSVFRPWFAASLAGSAIAAFFLFLLWLYEHARAEEMVEEWILGLPQLLGVHPTASEVLGWAESLYTLQESNNIVAWRRAISRELLIQCAERLLTYGEELAALAILRDPIDWQSHAELARILSSSYALLEDGDPRSEALKQRVLDELAIVQALHPQVADVWICSRECAELLNEAEVELAALEKLATMMPERDPLVQYGLALFRHGFAGRAFALYRQLREEDPETAQTILQGYQLRAPER